MTTISWGIPESGNLKLTKSNTKTISIPRGSMHGYIVECSIEDFFITNNGTLFLSTTPLLDFESIPEEDL